jgi:CRISPR-associated endonuclease/helicase Cas3
MDRCMILKAGRQDGAYLQCGVQSRSNRTFVFIYPGGLTESRSVCRVIPVREASPLDVFVMRESSIEMDIPICRSLWGKLGDEGGRVYHPLIFHLLDVGHVCELLWQHSLKGSMHTWLSETLCLREDETLRWFCFWASLHDIGKATPAFQCKAQRINSQVYVDLQQDGYDFRGADSRTGHGILTMQLLRDLLKESDFVGSVEPRLAQKLATALGGHHGLFPQSGMAWRSMDNLGAGKWQAARNTLVEALATYWRVGDLPRPSDSVSPASLMTLAGLVSVSDWIASNEEFFPYESGRLPLRTYAAASRTRAESALNRLAWCQWQPPAAPASLSDLFASIQNNEPRPVQTMVAELDLNSAGLVIIEVPTGEGKTEAAMYLADRWATRLKQRGCYFALPTQATSNQMFSRVRQYLESRYHDERVNALLLHGHAALSAEFKQLRDNADKMFSPGQVEQDAGDEGEKATVLAAEWFTHRKRGLLAPFGVGTIDQVLLSVLQTRHVFVRLFGLGHKTIILDEVHAYDTYMTTLIERLLEWLAALGSSVVLLSATLPNSRRRRLAEAFNRGLGGTAELSIAEPYPRVTWLTRDKSGEQHVATSEQSRKHIRLRHIEGGLAEGSEVLPWGEELRAALKSGGCAAVICNTVTGAQKTYTALKSFFDQDELDILHARYPFGEREVCERRALTRFGKPGDPDVERPERAVLVSTQVIEQSLDLDFDLMVTDLAPMDLLLQRAGRLHRHDRPERPEALGEPTLWIVQSELDEDSVPLFARGKSIVYDPHVLLRTWLALRDRPVIRVPDDVEELVEAVYDNRECPDSLPKELAAVWCATRDTCDGVLAQQQAEAHTRWIKSPSFDGALWHMTVDSKGEEAPELHQAHRALTRLGGPTVNVVCLAESEAASKRKQSGGPSPRETESLLNRSLSLSHRGVVSELLREEPPSAWRRSSLLRHHRLLILDERDASTIGRYRIHLDSELGLIIEQNEGGTG